MHKSYWLIANINKMLTIKAILIHLRLTLKPILLKVNKTNQLIINNI